MSKSPNRVCRSYEVIGAFRLQFFASFPRSSLGVPPAGTIIFPAFLVTKLLGFAPAFYSGSSAAGLRFQSPLPPKKCTLFSNSGGTSHFLSETRRLPLFSPASIFPKSSVAPRREPPPCSSLVSISLRVPPPQTSRKGWSDRA